LIENRENIDLLWELVQAAQAVGWHKANLHTEPTIEKFSDAYQQQVQLMSKVFLKMERITEKEFAEIMRSGG
jgi:hypothetical protein